MARRRPIAREALVYYLRSSDFNGLPVRELLVNGWTPTALRSTLRRAIQKGKVFLVFGDKHPNPHIQAFAPDSIESQLSKLEGDGFLGGCVYPAMTLLKRAVDSSDYAGRPFTLRLALGSPQLDFEVFDLSVLEAYRNDPRYIFDCNDIGGHLGIHDEFYANGKVSSADEVGIRFGFAHDDSMNRAVAVFLVDLHRLSSEHQQIWNARRVPGVFRPHPDWWRTQMGHWPEGGSVFDAFLCEFKCLNEMCELIGRPPIFRDIYSDGRPRNFAFLLRPTQSAFSSFVHLLDKMLSDNLNRDFFEAEGLSMEVDEIRKDGRTVVRQKGTLQLLQEWFAKRFRTADRRPIEDALAALKEVRRLRQRPAHVIDEDRFDQVYFKTQRELVLRAYGAVRVLRLVLANHPLVKGYRVPEWLHEGRIWPF